MPTAEARAQRQRALIVATLALVVTLVVNSIVGATLIYTRAQTVDYSECTARWQQQFSMAYKARSDSNADVTEALSKVILSLPPREDAQFDRERFQAAVTNYVAVYNQQVKDREATPLPPLPETLCGKIGGN